MDPELAKIRREAYLLHKRQRKVVEDSSSSDKPAAEAEVIDVDNFEEKITASWACDRCTFVNDFKRNSCEMCDHIHSVRSAADSSNASSKKAKTNHPCYVNGNILYDPHPRSTESGGWIWAENRSTSQKREDVSGLLSSFQALAAKSKLSRDEVLQLAKQHNVASGKWLLYQKAEYVAEVWGKIRDAMYEGKLGDVAKIAKDTQNGTFVICVYCHDFADRDDVLRVRKALWETAQIKTKIFFKPDCFTHLDIYSNSRFKIRPTIYSCGMVDGAEMSLTDVK